MGGLRFILCFRQFRQSHSSKDANDSDHHHQFDESEAVLLRVFLDDILTTAFNALDERRCVFLSVGDVARLLPEFATN